MRLTIHLGQTDIERERERERERATYIIPSNPSPYSPLLVFHRVHDKKPAIIPSQRQNPCDKTPQRKKIPAAIKKPTTNPRLIRQNLPVSKPPLLPKKPLRQTPYDKPSSASATKLTLLQKNPNDKFSQNKTTCNKNLNRPCDKAHLHVCFNKKSELMRMRRATASV